MKKSIFSILFGTLAHASNLNPMTVLNSNRVVTCYGDDNISIVLNSKRNAIKYTIEGESSVSRVYKVSTDKSSYVSYISKEGWLTFNERGSYYRDSGDEQSTSVDCKMAR